MGSVAIFAGNDAKLLKSNLDFGESKILTGTFSSANNQSSAANVTGLVFANASHRSAEVTISVFIDATSDLAAKYTLSCIQKSSSWEMSQEYAGDVTGIVFSITSAGQVQYTSTNISGFSAGIMKFSAITTDA